MNYVSICITRNLYYRKDDRMSRCGDMAIRNYPRRTDGQTDDMRSQDRALH